jgi:hypothetical protein
MFDTGAVDEYDLLQNRLAAQHWQQPWQELRNALPIPRRGLQYDCQILVRARLVWSVDGAETIDSHVYAWAGGRPHRVLVQVTSTRLRIGGAWLPARDVAPRSGAQP